MATDIKLPELGEGVTEGELIKWLVKPGDSVKADQSIAEIMTDKATVEVPTPTAGVVKDLKFKVGDMIKVESVLLTLDSAGAGAAATSTATAAATSGAAGKTSGSTATAAVNSFVAGKPAGAAGASGSAGTASTASKTTTAASTAASPSASGGKPVDVKLPELGEGVTEGELIKWLVKPGDSVKADQSIAEIMTDKATVEVPTPVAGVIKDLKFKTGDMIKVESILLTLIGGASTSAAEVTSAVTGNGHTSAGNGPSTIGDGSSKPTSQPAMSASPSHASMAANPAMNVGSTSTTAMGTTGANFYPPVAESRVLATPATRRMARELGVDINAITGTGLAGRVTREDVLSRSSGGSLGNGAGATRAGSPQMALRIPQTAYQGPVGAVEERVAIRGIRKKIAENMQMAKAIIPHFTLMDEANVTELVYLREMLKDVAESYGTKITYLPFVMKALIATIREEFPMFNASIDDKAQEIVYKKYYNIGFAADTPNGLVVPVVKNADHKSILEISKEILDLSKRARDGKLKSEEMKGATITITNIGSVGGTYATPIINHPEVAILGMYKISDKPVITDGKLSSIKVMNYTITADHRLIDGAVAANFLKSFLGRIQKPGHLMLELR